MSPRPTPRPDDAAVASPGDLTWHTDHLLGEPFLEADLGPATLVRYTPGDPVHPGDGPASGRAVPLVEVPPGARPEQRQEALDRHGYYLQRVIPSWRVALREALRR